MTNTAMDPMVALRMQSIERHFRELESLTRQLPRFQPDGLSAELQSDVEQYAAELAELSTCFKSMCTPILQALAQLGAPGLENPSLDDLYSLVAVARANQLVNLEHAVKVAIAAKDLADRTIAELKPQVSELETAFADTLVQVKIDLETIGQGVVTTQAGRLGNNALAAERQFDHLARQNVRSQKALADLGAAKSRLDAAAASGPRGQHQAEKIRSVLTQITLGEIRV